MGICSLYAQIEVQQNGTVRVGNTATPLFDPANTRLEVHAPKVVIKNEVASPWGGYVGFQIFPSVDIDVGTGGLNRVWDVMTIAGLSDRWASIGRSDNRINRVYAVNYYASGRFIGVLSSSDISLKDNIRNLSAATDRISRLRPVMYDFMRDGSGQDVSRDPAYQNRVGFIAQEVQRIFPELVVANIVGEGDDAEELFSLDYAGLIPYLVKSMQEQNAVIQAQVEAIQVQNETINRLQQEITDIRTGAFLGNFDIDMPNHSPQQVNQVPNHVAHVLHQNVPNPFNNATTITFHLAEGVGNAKICIYNLTGKQLQCYNLPTTQGENSIEVRALSLQPGMYLYSLIVDGRLIDTKRMILTE
jgi:hypothetical protein